MPHLDFLQFTQLGTKAEQKTSGLNLMLLVSGQQVRFSRVRIERVEGVDGRRRKAKALLERRPLSKPNLLG